MRREWDEAYYVLSCLNQFDIPTRGPKALSADFYNALVFGLFRPLSNANTPVDRDQQYATKLLSMLAFQLRMLRRRGVIPTLAGLGVLLLAFVFSVVLAFAQSDEDRTISNLTLGLLYSCWLPLLLISTIIDRNPVSAERSAYVISRLSFR
jgi:asparagine N-glycosylation enzyme membrane subunit Stt3